MKAVGFFRSHPIDHPEALLDLDLPEPVPGPHDLLVRVAAVSVNPADAKIRSRSARDARRETARVPGYDAVGEVVAMGEAVTGFAPGDRVWYAGDVTRQGSDAELQAVDARITAHAPKSLDDAAAAALPLTALTAWEALFDRLEIPMGRAAPGATLLIIGGAGGVGSIATQIARHYTGLTVITTASRPESRAWSLEMGADHVVDHRNLVAEVRALGFRTVDYIFNTADTAGHWEAMVELIRPQGRICGIVEHDRGIDLSRLQGKSAGFVWEWMFTRPVCQTADIARQGEILATVAAAVDDGRLKTTLTRRIAGMDAAGIRAAHRAIESGMTIGKIAITR